MRSFSLLALAAAALAPFVAAAPAPINAVNVHARIVDADVAAKAAAAVQARQVPSASIPSVPTPIPSVPVDVPEVLPRDGKRGVATILVGLKVDLQVHIDALYALDAKTATKDALVPILKAIVSVVVAATVELKALVGADISLILISVDGTAQLAVGVIAQLLADVLCLIFGALGFVLKTVADVKIIIDALVAVAFGDCICGLISAILALVDGLLVALIPLVLGLVGIILALGLDVIGKLLTIC